MNDGFLQIRGIEYLKITNCELKKEVNEHGWAIINGYIAEKNIANYRNRTTSGDWFALEEIYNGQKKVIMSGIIYSASVFNGIGVYEVRLELRGEVIAMDITPRIRIFQDNSVSIRTILSHMSYDANYVIDDEFEKNIPHTVVQYEETDWNFIKRVISEVGGYIIPDYKGSGCRFSIGVSSRNIATVNTNEYEMVYNPSSYIRKKENGVPISIESDDTEYIYRTRRIYELGDGIMFNGLSLYVYRIYGSFRKQELIFTYTLKHKNGFLQEKKKNYNIIGMSLNATVQSIVNDTVTVTFDNTEGYGSRTYQYATIYSSADGAGWYCMPEVGDKVRICFPTENPEQAYAISSVHLSMGDKNPNVKFIRNVHGKEITFSEKELKFTNNKGLDIILNDDEGITINSNKSININASDKIDIISTTDKVSVEGKDGVELLQGNSKILVDEDLTLIGEQVHVQGLE